MTKEFQQLLYDLVMHVVVGDLEVEDALSFFSELTSSLVRWQATYFVGKNVRHLRTEARSCDYHHRGLETHFLRYWPTFSQY